MKEEPLHIAVLAGTSRPKRASIHVARFIADVGQRLDGVETQLVDPTQFTFPGDGNDEEGKDPKYTRIVEQSDAFFVVVPEYNHGYPGTLKRMLDSELSLYIHKPVAFAGVSSGPWGGVRGIEALVNAVREMGLVATFTDVQFPKVGELFDETGTIQDPAYKKRVERAYTELLWMAKTFAYGRETIPSKYHKTS